MELNVKQHFEKLKKKAICFIQSVPLQRKTRKKDFEGLITSLSKVPHAIANRYSKSPGLSFWSGLEDSFIWHREGWAPSCFWNWIGSLQKYGCGHFGLEEPKRPGGGAAKTKKPENKQKEPAEAEESCLVVSGCRQHLNDKALGKDSET